VVLFYSLLKHQSEYTDIQTMPDIDITTEYQSSPFS